MVILRLLIRGERKNDSVHGNGFAVEYRRSLPTGRAGGSIPMMIELIKAVLWFGLGCAFTYSVYRYNDYQGRQDLKEFRTLNRRKLR